MPVIYEMINKSDNKSIYVGSSQQTLCQRRGEHKYNFHTEGRKHYSYQIYKYIREIGGWDMIEFRKIVEYKKMPKVMLVQKEDEYIAKRKEAGNNLQNIRRCRTTKVPCVCGSNVQRKGYKRHLNTNKHKLYILENANNN